MSLGSSSQHYEPHPSLDFDLDPMQPSSYRTQEIHSNPVQKVERDWLLLDCGMSWEVGIESDYLMRRI